MPDRAARTSNCRGLSERRAGAASSPHDYHIPRCDRRRVGDCMLEPNGCRATRRRLGRLRRRRIDARARIRGVAAHGVRALRRRDSGVAGSIRRRTGEPMLDGRDGRRPGRLGSRSRAAAVSRCAARGTATRSPASCSPSGKPSGRRIRLVRRTHAIRRREDLPAVARRGVRLAVRRHRRHARLHEDARRRAARELHRAPRRQRDRSASSCSARRTRAFSIRPGRYWASRGYIFVAQHVRGRDVSDGNDFGDYDTDVRDGYDAVEWAAKLPGANGRVGLIGHSDEGRLAWYAAVSAPPHLAAIAPSAATGDPWRIVPYEDMVFSPINVAWACLMRARTLQNISDLDIGSALTHLPLSDLPQQLGCGDVPLWDRWIAHPDARRVLARARRHDEHREGPRAGAADLRLVRRFARADRLHERAEQGPGPSVHSARDGPGRAQGRRLRRRRVRAAVARRDATTPAPLVRPLPARQGQRRRHGAAGRHLRLRRQHVAQGSRVAARARGADEVVRVVRRHGANTSAGDGVLDTLPPSGARRPTRSPTIRRIRRPTSSIRASSRRRSTRTSRRSTPRGATRWCSRRSRSRSRSR